MRRGVHLEKSSWNLDEILQSPHIQSVPPTEASTKKFQKIKNLEEESRCHSARPKSRETENQTGTARTRSVSPKPSIPPLDAKLPLRKFYKFYSKIVVQLETVKNITETKRNESENLIDLRRQLQRADEFSIRFSRNNLYETKRIVNEIKQLIVPYPFENLSQGHCRILCKKIISAFQAASQSLQAYINYAKSHSNLEVPDKISELVLLIADLFLCCEHVSLPPNDVYIKNDAVKVCNDLITLLKSKVPVCDYVELKEATLTKKKQQAVIAEPGKMNKLSMYEPKFSSKLKVEVPKTKVAVPCLLGVRNKKPKKDDKKARITHEIYTQKLNPRYGKMLGNKIVKFKPEAEEKGENQLEKKLLLKRPKYVTPREVRSQDDDVVTMVQSIEDDDVSVHLESRLGSPPKELDEDRNNLKELLLEAIEELEGSDKKEQKTRLKKLLNSIRNSSKSRSKSPNPDRVKVYHLLSNDILEEVLNKHNNEVGISSNISLKPLEVEVTADKTEEKNKEEVIEKPKSRLLFKPVENSQTESKGVPRERIKLKMSEESMAKANHYRKAFAEYRRNNIMYKKTLANKPWELVGKMSDRIISDLIKEMSTDFQNDAMLRRLYISELLEVTS